MTTVSSYLDSSDSVSSKDLKKMFSKDKEKAIQVESMFTPTKLKTDSIPKALSWGTFWKEWRSSHRTTALLMPLRNLRLQYTWISIFLKITLKSYTFYFQICIMEKRFHSLPFPASLLRNAQLRMNPNLPAKARALGQDTLTRQTVGEQGAQSLLRCERKVHLPVGELWQVFAASHSADGWA